MRNSTKKRKRIIYRKKRNKIRRFQIVKIFAVAVVITILMTLMIIGLFTSCAGDKSPKDSSSATSGLISDEQSDNSCVSFFTDAEDSQREPDSGLSGATESDKDLSVDLSEMTDSDTKSGGNSGSGIVSEDKSDSIHPLLIKYKDLKIKYEAVPFPRYVEERTPKDFIEVTGSQKVSWLKELEQYYSTVDAVSGNDELYEITMFLWLTPEIAPYLTKGNIYCIDQYGIGNVSPDTSQNRKIGYLLVSVNGVDGSAGVSAESSDKGSVGGSADSSSAGSAGSSVTGSRTDKKGAPVTFLLVTEAYLEKNDSRGKIKIVNTLINPDGGDIGKRFGVISPRNPISAEESDDTSSMINFDPLDFGVKGKGPYKLRQEAVSPILNMLTSAKNDGVKNPQIRDTYRGYNVQAGMFDSRVKRRLGWGLTLEEAFKLTELGTAYPGTSEHHNGLTADLSYNNLPVESEFAKSPFGLWLKDNAHKYGFIIRYPEGKEKETTKKYEPWHVRFVGTELASFIYKNKISLDEFHAYMESKGFASGTGVGENNTGVYLFINASSRKNTFVGVGIPEDNSFVISDRGDGGVILLFSPDSKR